MTDKDISARPLEGAMFLYERPELLTREIHGSLGLTRPDAPFDFTRTVRALPVTLSELPSVQKHYPVIFSDLDNPVLLAIFGITDGTNLFVDPNGEWDQSAYIPAYLRCYPFALAKKSDDELAVVIDRAAASLSENPEVSFFEGGELTAETQAIVDLCGRYEMDRRKTDDFCKRVKSLGLLSPHRAVRKTPDVDENLADYYAIEAAKLTKLDKDKIIELFLDRSLAAIYSHLFSLENWHRLVERRNRLNSA
jgi:hypothetical protein